MNQDNVDQEFAVFTDEYDYVATEIMENMRDSSHLMEMADSNHAKWHEDSLGVLIVLPYEHVMAFAAEKLINDFDNSPLHSHVFSTISQLIMRAAHALEEFEEDLD